MNKTMDEEHEETRLSRLNEKKRIQLKLKREQQKYHSIILKTTKELFFEAQKISYGMVIRIAGNGKVLLLGVLPSVKWFHMGI